MRNTTKFVLTFAVAVVLLYGFGIVGVQKGWFFKVDFAFDEDDIGGFVTSPNGVEAGVWVIAETTDLPEKFVKIVVTDERGRYVLPDLPFATYDVWVRGYGLVDSARVKAQPGMMLNLTATTARNAQAAAQYYPAAYWYSLLKIPDRNEFPGHGTGAGGNGIPATLMRQGEFLELVKTDGCLSCHQMGNAATRLISDQLGTFESPYDAWERRIQLGQASAHMVRAADRLGTERWLSSLANWSDRIAAGELPKAVPQRPQGMERNLVLTLWDWSDSRIGIDDQVSSDTRNPNYNANGPIFGISEASSDVIQTFDPGTNTKSEIKIPVRDPKTPSTKTDPIFFPSPSWGEERIFDSQANAHEAMFDEKGRLWLTQRIRPAAANPAFCKRGSQNASAKLFPLDRSDRQLAFYDLSSKQFTLIDTCFTTHRMVLDKNGVLWFSEGRTPSDVVGWFDTRKFDATHDAQASQGWTVIVADTNGSHTRDAYVEPDAPIDMTKDKRFRAGFFDVAVSPSDNAIWGSVSGDPGAIVRLEAGANPPSTALAEYYELPSDAAISGYGARGLDVDSNGVVWMSLMSGHLASFDRRKCPGPFYGPDATGAQCREGWTLYPFTAPQFEGVTDKGSAESGYSTYVDRFDTLGLGRDVPIATTTISDALVAVVNGTFVTLRVPYPIGFYAKAVDGRIDDAAAGWKGKGLWSAFAGDAVQHLEGGKGTTSKVVHFQLRPDPLAH